MSSCSFFDTTWYKCGRPVWIWFDNMATKLLSLVPTWRVELDSCFHCGVQHRKYVHHWFRSQTCTVLLNYFLERNWHQGGFCQTTWVLDENPELIYSLVNRHAGGSLLWILVRDNQSWGKQTIDGLFASWLVVFDQETQSSEPPACLQTLAFVLSGEVINAVRLTNLVSFLLTACDIFFLIFSWWWHG